MSETLRKLGLIGIGVLAITEEKIRQTVDELIEKGEMNREEGKSLVQELLTEKKKQMQELGDTISNSVQNSIDRSKIAEEMCGSAISDASMILDTCKSLVGDF